MNDVMNGIIIKTVSKFPVYVVFTNTYQIKTGRHYPRKHYKLIWILSRDSIHTSYEENVTWLVGGCLLLLHYIIFGQNKLKLNGCLCVCVCVSFFVFSFREIITK